MKLSGNSRHGKHVQSHSGKSQGRSREEAEYQQSVDREQEIYSRRKQNGDYYRAADPRGTQNSRGTAPMRGAAQGGRTAPQQSGRSIRGNGQNTQSGYPPQQQVKRVSGQNINQLQNPSGAKKKTSGKRVVIVVLVIVALLVAAVAVLWKMGVRPPTVNNARRPSVSPAEGNKNETRPAETRKGDSYTFLILGMDDGNGNTDTIMVANFDTNDYTLNVVNIPRDTMVNVDWYVKKANTLYAYGDVEGVLDGVADILGFEVDFYVIVDLQAFEELVDAVGGVEFDVPQDMDYEDPAQDLYIHLTEGKQTLNGSDAIGVVRFRSGYEDADIGRIRTQQEFLKSAAMQIIQKKDSIKITSLAEIFLKYVETNLDIGNLIWLAQEFFKMDAENINFFMVPSYVNDSVDGISFVSIYIEPWLEMLNEKLNPFETEIKATDLSILTRDANGNLYATDGNLKGDPDWGYGSGAGYDPNYTPYTPPTSSNSGGNSGGSGWEDPEPLPSYEDPEPYPSYEDPEPSPSYEDPEPSPSGGEEDPEPSPSGGEEDPEPSPSGGEEDPEPSPSGGEEDPPPDTSDNEPGSEEGGGDDTENEDYGGEDE